MIIARLFLQTFALAISQIWANRVRSLLTTLGIIIGVAAVIAIVGATKGLEGFVLKEFGTVGANKVWIFPQFPPGLRDRYSFRQVRIKTREADGILQNAPSIARLSPVIEMSGTVEYGDVRKELVPARGVRSVWLEIENRELLQGRPFSRIDEDERRRVCLVNDKAIEELGLPKEPVGQSILYNGQRFLIIGVIDTKTVSPMFGGNEARSEVYIPFQTAESMRPEPRMFIVAQTTSPEKFEDARAEIQFYLRKVRNLQPDEPNTFGIQAIEQFIAQFKRISSGLTAAAAGIVAISLLVGGIGIMNIMLSSVSERTREIGLRKAVGAKPLVILMQFLVEAVTLCLIGALAGLAVGFGIVHLLTLIPEGPLSEASVPMWAVVLSVGFSAATGIVFGMFPAIKAARLDPIEALRHE